jgi:hypothetical protein
VTISGLILLRMGNVQTEFVEKTKHVFYVQ